MSRYQDGHPGRYPNQAFEHYWQMWNSPDLDQAARLLELAVTDDVEFCDPAEHYVGKQALMENVRALRDRFPTAHFELRSGFDHHHNRYRYRWDMIVKGRTIIEGMDVTTVSDDGLLQRIDGFFGPIPEHTEDADATS